MRKGRRIMGRSYAQRVREVNRIYEEHINSGLSNREILRRYIYPVYPISESTLYNMLKAEYRTEPLVEDNTPTLFSEEEMRNQ